MNGRFHVNRNFGIGSSQSVEAVAPVEAVQPARSWHFVDKFQGMAGEDTEPDTLFFVESWTLGMSAALENLQRRRASRTRRPALPATESTASYVERQTSEEDFFSPSDAWAVTEACCMGPSEAHAELASGTPDSGPSEQEWEVLLGEYDGDATEAMTEERACSLLGVDASYTSAQLKAAYRRKVSQWHPDRLQRLAEKQRQLATRQMAAINEAHHLLRECLLRQTA